MPIGLINTQAAFQRIKNDISNGIPFVKMHDNKAEVFSKSLDDHLSDSRQKDRHFRVKK